MIAMALAWNYADRPSSPSVMALGAWTGVAFLFRHDYAVYVAFASAAMLFVCHWSERSELVRRTSVFLVGLLAVVAPWLIYVQVHQGVMEYLASALRFSIVEGNRTVGRWPLVFYAMTAVPALAFLIGVRGTRTLTSAHVAFCCLLVLLSDLALLRDSAGSRLPDVYATTGVAVAVILGRLLSPRILRLANIVVVIVVAVAAIPLVARAASRHEVPDVVQRWRLVASRLREAREEIMPVPEYAAIVRYISRCTTPEDRILVGGFAPELAVLSHRAYAGGLPYWLGGYYEDEADVTRARRWLAGEQLGLALLLEGAESFAQSWPSIAADLRARGFKPYALTLPGERIEVWLPEVAASYRVDAETNLPCAASGCADGSVSLAPLAAQRQHDTSPIPLPEAPLSARHHRHAVRLCHGVGV